MPELLRIEGMSVEMPGAAGPVTIVDALDLSVAAGEVLGVAGESGSGKTMTALALLRLLPPTAAVTGSATFQGRDLLRLPRRDLQEVRGGQIGMVFQDPMTSLHPMLTVGHQLTDHMRRHLSIGKAEALERARTLLAEVRIPDPERAVHAYPHQFSGGMRQRIAIAAALACEPRLLIADEPTTALDVTVQAGILRLLKELCETYQMALVIVTHDLGVMSSLADRLAIFYAGRVVEIGPTRALLRHPRHPYTERLLAALPDPDDRHKSLEPIGGAPATPASRPPGCAFHPRCPHAEPSCTGEVPPLLPAEDGREFACPVDPFRTSP